MSHNSQTLLFFMDNLLSNKCCKTWISFYSFINFTNWYLFYRVGRNINNISYVMEVSKHFLSYCSFSWHDIKSMNSNKNWFFISIFYYKKGGGPCLLLIRQCNHTFVRDGSQINQCTLYVYLKNNASKYTTLLGTDKLVKHEIFNKASF